MFYYILYFDLDHFTLSKTTNIVLLLLNIIYFYKIYIAFDQNLYNI